MIRASPPYTSGWGSFVLLKMDCVRVSRGGSLITLQWFRYEVSYPGLAMETISVLRNFL